MGMGGGQIVYYSSTEAKKPNAMSKKTTEERDDLPGDEEEEDDELDEWDQRIEDTGCAEENLALTECHAATGDWRKCTKEMEAFKSCWEKMNNNVRTETKNNS